MMFVIDAGGSTTVLADVRKEGASRAGWVSR
jgi:hypothetical protein